MEPIIKVNNLKIIYNRGKDNEYTALNDINIEIFPQEYVIFFGPSGCGKSTTLYSILGLQAPSEGKVYIQGRDSSAFNEMEKSKETSQFFGIIFQNYNLIYSLNVMDNITLPQAFINVASKERKEKALKLVKRFGIEARAKNLPSTLSGGQQQRVAICRALINDPVVLLADEPVGNLDSESAEVVMETLKDINVHDKKTIILVTHDARYLPYADRIYYFKDARIERMVVNRRKGVKEEKEALGVNNIINAFEKTATEHTHMDVLQLKAWIMTMYLTQELNLTQRQRLEKELASLLKGKISQHAFFEQLDRPYGKGGVGLYRPTAIKYSLRVGRILQETKELRETNFKSEEAKKEKIISLLHECFFDCGSTEEMSKDQRARLMKAASERVFGVLTMEEMVEMLCRPQAEGGVGLALSHAACVAERLEIILSQLL